LGIWIFDFIFIKQLKEVVPKKFILMQNTTCGVACIIQN